jgi:hypothetical protein
MTVIVSAGSGLNSARKDLVCTEGSAVLFSEEQEAHKTIKPDRKSDFTFISFFGDEPPESYHKLVLFIQSTKQHV